jgi:hypothetical protein
MNLQADAMTRAAQLALRELKQLGRDAGTRDRDFRISDRAKAIADHLAKHPEIVERASAEVAAWKKGRRIRGRSTPDFWARLTTGANAE